MNYYQILEAAQNATQEELKAAYRRLSKKYHPDVNPGDKQAEKRFQELSEAYAVLGDREKRKAYDLTLKQGNAGRAETKNTTTGNSRKGPASFDFYHMSDSFEQFFGFHPDTGDIRKDKLNPKKEKKTNPIDMTDLFETYMGFQNKGGNKD